MTAGLARPVAAGAAGLAALVLLVGAAGAGAVSGVVGGLSGDVAPNPAAVAAIPAAYLGLYQQAAATCSGLGWTVLAAIGTVESGNGTSTLPGVHAGANYAGAEGPMQFEPATFAEYDQPVPPGGADPPSPYDPTDAIYAAARMLCANGARGGANLPAAIYAYNHDPAYVQQVMDIAANYGQPLTGDGVASADAAAIAVAYAEAQIGTPYRWGGDTPGVGFDCSGLVQAAYAAAGISLPRTAQAQYDATARLPAGAALSPGDLLFFGNGPTDVTHVGIYVGNANARAVMIDAPHSGALVRMDAVPATLGMTWGDDHYLGATQP